MTDMEKKQIICMREQNLTYAAIAEEIGIPESTIKTFCRRNSMMAVRTPKKKDCCKNCGAKISNTEKTARTRVFCSVKCKQTWWNKHRNERHSEKIVPHSCLVCGKQFLDYSGANRKYCSQVCYHKRGMHNGK